MWGATPTGTAATSGHSEGNRETPWMCTGRPSEARTGAISPRSGSKSGGTVPTSQAPYEPIRPGPIRHLATVENMERCRFRTEFKVPDVRPRTYRVVTFVFHEGGYGWFGEHRFRVTS
jgi:hypothetical protein